MWVQLSDKDFEFIAESFPGSGLATRLREFREEQSDPDCGRYRELADAKWSKEGEIEIDDGASVSLGCDPGAYVMAWLWVYDPERKDESE